MSKNNKADATITNVADVRMGKYHARLNEEDIELIADIAEDDTIADKLAKFDAFFIEVYEQDRERAAECMELMSLLRCFKSDYDRMARIDIRRD